jgi:hypothetical protein
LLIADLVRGLLAASVGDGKGVMGGDKGYVSLGCLEIVFCLGRGVYLGKNIIWFVATL